MSLARLSATLDRMTGLGVPRRRGTTVAIVSDYKPWSAQRHLHASKAKFKVMVSGRGVGKTHCAAHEGINAVLAEAPGAEGGVLAPTYRHAAQAASKLARMARVIPGAAWHETRKELSLPGGRKILVFSADRKEETVRGPSLVWLWIDEGAFVKVEAVKAAMPALRAGRARLLVTTTPAGKNWVWEWWQEAPKKPDMARFRFRSKDSPYVDQQVMALSRSLMSPEAAAQEFDAEFVDNLLLAFPNSARLFVREGFKARHPLGQCWLGVDLARKDDWSVLTLMNEWGETWVRDRWQESSAGEVAGEFWRRTYSRIRDTAKDTGATVVIDTGGAGGAVGEVIAEQLRAEGIEVLEVRTNVQGTKAQVVEQARNDAEFGRFAIACGEHTDQLAYELGRFQGLRKPAHHGQTVITYEGPQLPGEFDDCVISLCLANWGRSRGEREERGDGGLGSFRVPGGGKGGGGTRGPASGGGRPRGGYFFK